MLHRIRFAFHLNKILIFKRKKRKKESIYTWRRGWLQRSNAIKDGIVQWVVFMAEISLQTKIRACENRLTCLTFFYSYFKELFIPYFVYWFWISPIFNFNSVNFFEVPVPGGYCQFMMLGNGGNPYIIFRYWFSFFS